MLEQRYDVGDVAHRERLTGTTIFSFADGTEQLLLFHLGAQSAPHGTDAEAGEAIGAPESLGEVVRRRRREAKLSLRELGRRADLSPSFLSQLERGAAEPSIASLLRIAAVPRDPARRRPGSAGRRGTGRRAGGPRRGAPDGRRAGLGPGP